MTFDELKELARQRSAGSSGARTRVMLQLGQCCQAVGGAEVAHALEEALKVRPDADLVMTGCDGACFAAPQVVVNDWDGSARYYCRVSAKEVPDIVADLGNGQDSPPSPDLEGFFTPQHLQVMSWCGQLVPHDVLEYVSVGGYASLADALSLMPEEVIKEVLESGLQGRGGAYFPPARKWQGARSFPEPRFLVVNAEEGEPGLFKDRHIMEGVPHRLLEGALIAAYATGASRCFIYINAEAHLAAERMQQAMDQAHEYGLAGDDILGSGFGCDLEIRRGAGGYVCGEETTLLNTIEGRRREPRLRPPFPVESGLFRQPTVINNVETLSNLPYILQRGPGRYGQVGLETAPGTKLVCLSGSVQRPGLAEVPMGASLRQVIYGIGGGSPEGREVGLVAVGGPSSGILPPTELDLELKPGMLHPSGVVMGAGGVMVLDTSVSPLDVARRLAAYNAAESCGKCTPCREGTPRIVAALDRLATGKSPSADAEELRYLSEIVAGASLCGLGQMAGGPVNSLLHFFGDGLSVH
ncbi:MAG: NADH-quinone oxidoreductase subunit F [Chloroflexi bacterium]|nr:NADH-quinone oxidoreductase subunit F [Chloroflexota bacterium]